MKYLLKKYSGWAVAAALGAGNIAYPFLPVEQKVAIDLIFKPVIEAIKNESTTD